jgi:excisionase family DNA binding protein
MRRRSRVKLTVQDTGEEVSLSKQALQLLAEIMADMAQGKRVAIVATQTHLTTQEAADALNMSRPHLIKLLNRGHLPFVKVGSHRRIALVDLKAYQAKQKLEREAELQFLAEQAQALHLGY